MDLSLYSDIVSGHIARAIGHTVVGQHVLSMCFFFYIFDGWSLVKLTGSMFFSEFFLLYFRWMVDREVDGQHVFSLLFFFDMFDGWSIVMLTGLCGWS